MTPRRSLVWLVALVVAASVAATAHGLYAVALTSGVPWRVATLYPLITDGLALVAYAATKQLRSARYAWFVVVVAAGLSGLAQAVNLAGLGESPVWLRFGVGYWPAVAALLAAHLWWLVRRGQADVPAVPALPANGNGAGRTLTDKATATALAYEAEHGRRPSRDRLAELVGCSGGTAGKALQRTRSSA